MIDFPTTPVVGETFTVGDLVYVWNGQGWAIQIGSSTDTEDFPAGSVMFFFQAAAPAGWTKLVTQNDRTLRVSDSVGGTAGGVNAFSTVMAQSAVGNHTQVLAELATHVHAGLQYGGGSMNPVLGGPMPNIVNNNYTGSTGLNGAHNHPVSMNIRYVDVILASRN